MERLAVPLRSRDRILAVMTEGVRAQRLVESKRVLTAGEVWELLSPLPREAVVYAWARTSRRAAAAAMERFLKESVHVSTAVRGRDLQKMGYPPGPSYRHILSALLRARIDGQVTDAGQERVWVREHFPLPARSA